MANSLIDFGVVQPEAGVAFLRGFQQSQALAQQKAQQQRQNALADLQLRAAQRGEEEALAEREAYKGAATLGDVQQRLMQSGLGKQSIALQKQVDEQTAAKLKRATDIHKLVQDSLRGVAALGTRESAQGALANAKAAGLDVGQYEAELAQTPDAQIRQWALSHAAGADKALEQQIIDLGGATAIRPRYDVGGPAMQPQAKQPAGTFQGEPQQVMNQLAAIADPAERAAATQAYQRQLMAQAPSGAGIQIPKMLSPAQQATEAREQQRLSMEQERLRLAQQAASPEFEQRMAAAKTTGAEQAKASVARQELMKQIDRTIPELENATKKGGLIDQSTGSGAGRAVDVSVGFFGKATPGAIATSRLQPIANMALMMVPRFEGPQSDKDTQTYKEASGQLANPSLPTEIRRQAGLEVLRLMKARKNQFVTSEMETIGAPVSPASPAAGKAKFLGFE